MLAGRDLGLFVGVLTTGGAKKGHFCSGKYGLASFFWSSDQRRGAN